MDRAEAIVAVEFNALCEHRGIIYYAYGNERIKEPGKPLRESIILHSIDAHSLTHASIESTKVLDWKTPEWLVEKRLEKARSRLEE